MLGAFEFSLKPLRKIVRPILEENDEAKGKEDKENEPKKPADDRHAADCNVTNRAGQRPGWSANLPLSEGAGVAILNPFVRTIVKMTCDADSPSLYQTRTLSGSNG